MRLRPAVAHDLPHCQAIWEAGAGSGDGAGPDEPNPIHPHELASGTMVVAEDDGTVVGFGASLDRPGRWFLADLFVDPDHHGGGVGRALLDHLTAAAPARRATLASDDRRGHALYARAGMVPRWPALFLRGPLPAPLPAGRLRPEPVAPGVARWDDLVEADRRLGGVHRPQDLAWWCGPDRAVPLWLVDEAGTRQGYSLVRGTTPWALDVGDREAAAVVAVQVRRPELAVDGVLAGLGWAAAHHRPTARLLVPGPHPALAPLLEAGYRIVDEGLLCASHADLFDPQRAIPSPTLG